jgi:membrane fusion protein, multidrug efflux system
MNRALTGIAMLALAAAPLACAKRKAAPSAPLPPPIAVETTAAEPKLMPQFLAVTGSLVANRRSEVAANAAGRVVRTWAERGDFAKRGASLIQLDTRTARWSEEEARANLQNAQAQLDLATATCTRNESLLQQGALTREEWERGTSQCRMSVGSAQAAKARAELAAKTLADATVRAPFAGMVSERFVNMGEYVQPSTRVATLVELDPLRLQFTVNEADLRRIRAGQQVTFEVEAFPGERFTGTVKYIDPTVRATTRDLVVEATVTNADHRLRPGMFATTRVPLPDERVVRVPRAALRRDAGGSRLFAVVSGRVEERVVQVGIEKDGYVAILDGLKAGELVVVDPGKHVRDGTPVK